jgi:hypothetical protein
MVREASGMGRTAGPDAAGGSRAQESAPGDETGVLDELRFHWGSAYDIGTAGGVYTARRRDGKGAPLVDALPEGLRLQIMADYQRLPVPRDLQ